MAEARVWNGSAWVTVTDEPHRNASDPHPQYLTTAEGNSAYSATGHTHPQSDVTNLASDLSSKAADNAVVKLTGAQTVGGVKTFSDPPLVPTPVAVGNPVRHDDGRLTDARTPTSHSHAQADVTNLTSELAGKVPTTRTVSAGNGLSGGGDLSANRSFAVVYGSGSNTAVQGNDARVTADQAGGSASIRTLGTGATQACAGNDTRLSNARTPTAHNHAAGDVNSGVLDIARIPTGTTGDTAALGNHSHAGAATTKLVPAASRSTANPGPGSAATGLITGAGATAYVLTELCPPVIGQNKLRLRYWNGRTFDGSPGEVNGPNTITIRAQVLYPCGVYRQVSGSTAWAAGTTYNAGDMVTNGGKIWVAYGPPITVGVAPAEGAQWHECIEYPVSFPGDDADRRVSVAAGAYIDSEDIDLGANRLTPGVSPYLGITTTLESGANGNQWKGGEGSGIGDFVVHYATTGAIPTPGAASDPVDSGFTNQTNAAAGTALPMPSVIYSPIDVTKAPPVLAFVGDSSILGTGDAFIGLYGWAHRTAELVSYLRMAQGGQQAAHFTSAHAYRDILLAGADAAIVTFGGNELNNSKSLATIQTELLAAWEAIRDVGPRVWATTITPVTTSTDAFATVANQTAFNASWGGAGTTYANLMKWLRDGAPLAANGQTYRAGQPGHPLEGVLDHCPPVVDPTSPWKWRAPGYTTDGAHGTATAAQILAAWHKSWIPTVLRGNHDWPLTADALHHVGAMTLPTEDATGTLQPVAGTIYLRKIRWPGGTMYQLHTWIATAGATLTSGQNLMGVYTLDGTRLGLTATQHTAWQSAGDKVAPLTSAVMVPAGEVYLAWICAGTTRPVFASSPVIGASPGVMNANLPNSVYRTGTGPTGQTTLPATINIATLTATQQTMWGAAS